MTAAGPASPAVPRSFSPSVERDHAAPASVAAHGVAARGGVPRLWYAAALAALVALAGVLALTRPPQTDEGHFASAGASFAAEGRLAMPMWTEWIDTLDRRLYSNMPLYFVALGAWFKAFGVTWWTMRALSIVFGVVLVVSLVATLRSIAGDRATATAGIVLTTLGYDLINFASARYDVVTAALSAAALACYLRTRERSLGRALLGANALLAAACLTHPYALFGMTGLATFVLWLDRRRLRPRHVALAAAPYVVALAAWGAYIAQDPAMFRAQFGANARDGRFAGPGDPLTVLLTEVRERYVAKFAGWRAGAPAAMRVKVLLLVAFAAGVIGCVADRRVSRNAAARALAAHTLFSIVLLAYLDATKWYIYLIYVVPQLVLCLALVAGAWTRAGGWQRRVVHAGLAGYALFGVASVAYRAKVDAHHRAYLPAARYLQQHVRPGDLVMAGGEFGPELGFARHVLDDQRLGFRNGRTPAYFVTSDASRAEIAAASARDTALARHVASMHARYRHVLTSSVPGLEYRVYARPPAAPPEPAR